MGILICGDMRSVITNSYEFVAKLKRKNTMLIAFTFVVLAIAILSTVRLYSFKRKYKVAFLGIQKLNSLRPPETQEWSEYDRPTWMRKESKNRYFAVGSKS